MTGGAITTELTSAVDDLLKVTGDSGDETLTSATTNAAGRYDVSVGTICVCSRVGCLKVTGELSGESSTISTG